MPSIKACAAVRRVCFVLLLLAAVDRQSATAEEASRISYAGTIGPIRIGLSLDVKSDAGGKRSVITGGHYYYARYLTDIPLTGALAVSSLTLHGRDGDDFQLNFVGNGSEAGKALGFANSVGLEGTWTNGRKTLPVKLTAEGSSSIPASGRWYEAITDETDADFEAKVRGFYQAVSLNKKNEAVKYVNFPLRVNKNGKSRMIRSPEELTAQWPQIFNSAFLATLRKDIPHDLAIVQGQAMLGAGDVWFNSKGVSALNLP